MYYAIGASVSSLHRESTDSPIGHLEPCSLSLHVCVCVCVCVRVCVQVTK